MIEIEEAKKYFGNCKEKYLKRFTEKTPQGNFIKGWICHKPNRYLGSLLIDTLWGESHEQFIQSMPKIEYFKDERDICLDSEICGISFTDAIAYEKLDGSCLILYPILDENDNIIEVVPKTRGRAVADSHFLELYNKLDKSAIWDYYAKHNGILFFEMYGILNQHDIIHYGTGIDIVLIGACEKNNDGEYEFALPFRLWLISVNHGFKQPDEMFKIMKDNVNITTQKYHWYFKEVDKEYEQAPTRTDSVSIIQGFLEYLNKTYNDMYGRYATEGVVINCVNNKGHQKYIKVKPKDIENKHKSEHGIPRSVIVKEVLKYFDDYGSQIDEIYHENKNHHTEYLHRMLHEEYSEEMIRKSRKKIEKIFMQIWENKQIPQSIHIMAEEIFDKYSDKGIIYCMKMFAQEKPYKKKYAKSVYTILEKLFVKNNTDKNGDNLGE